MREVIIEGLRTAKGMLEKLGFFIVDLYQLNISTQSKSTCLADNLNSLRCSFDLFRWWEVILLLMLNLIVLVQIVVNEEFIDKQTRWVFKHGFMLTKKFKYVTLYFGRMLLPNHRYRAMPFGLLYDRQFSSAHTFILWDYESEHPT